MDDDLILEILSHCSSTEIAKLRMVNKDLCRRTYEFFFIKRNLHRTNSVFGYLVEDCERGSFRYRFVYGIEEEEEETQEKNIISLKFLPCWRDLMVEACDTDHGLILLRVGVNRIPYYIICKPATKQYRIIPNPKTRYHTTVTGLMVIHQSNRGFRYKIVRVSEPMNQERRKTKDGFYNLNCEVFDSDSFAWNQLKDLELPWSEFIKKYNPVSSYGFLHWLTTENNVIRFCIKTETWSVFQVPNGLKSDLGLVLIRYEGKLGVINWKEGEKDDDIWIMKNSSGLSWEKVKDVTIKGSDVEPLWFISNDVISIANLHRIGLYNMHNNKSRYLMKKTRDYFQYSKFIPFYTNYETVDLHTRKRKERLKDKF